MCICLNCYYINVCKQYFIIEENHEEKHINEKPNFLASQSITNINFFQNTKYFEIEYDIVECLSFKEKPSKWTYYN